MEKLNKLRFPTKVFGYLLLLLFLPLLSSGQGHLQASEIVHLLDQQQDRLNLQSVDYKEFEVNNQYTDQHNGITHIYLQQMHRGIPLKGAYLGLHLKENGEMLHVANRFFSDKNQNIRWSEPAINQKEALLKACAHHQIAIDKVKILEQNLKSPKRTTVFAKGTISNEEIPVSLVFHPTRSGQLIPAWEIRIYTLDEHHYWITYIDVINGQVLSQDDLVLSCNFDHLKEDIHTHQCFEEEGLPREETFSFEDLAMENFNSVDNFYRVYDSPVEAPTFGNRTLVQTAGDPLASPLGWHDNGTLQFNITKGNNAYAYLDLSPVGQVGYTYGVGLPAVGGLPGQSPLVFDFPIDFNQLPQFYKDAAITNLFYWNNLIHDVFYNYGFTEAAGNFQWNNFGKGGAGLDPVLAEAQDPSLVNNANFFTPPDGLPGRMQMYLWTTNVPLLDGDLDNGVITHEYGHGISTRLTGGPGATCLSGDEQGGEGWSDFFALLMTMDPNDVDQTFLNGRGIGTYVLNEGTDGPGIRPAKYSTSFLVNNYTYGDITNSEISVPHGVGFIWCTMLWEMTNSLIQLYGYDPDIQDGNGGNNVAMQLVVDGLKLQPCGPTFVEMRDAILAADMANYSGAHQCLIWEAFAKRGLGFSASSGSNLLGDETEAFDLPPSFCQPIINMTVSAPDLAADNTTIQYQVNLENNSYSPISNISITDELPVGTQFVSASHSVNQSGNTLTFSNLSVPAQSSLTITITANVQSGSQASLLFRDDMENGPFNWDSQAGLNQFTWTNSDAYSGDYSFFAEDPNNLSNQVLQLANPIVPTANTVLRFAHRYNMETGFDGGLVEVSSDGGTTWTDLGDQFTQNGYSDFITLTDNPLIGGFAFGGNSQGFIHSMADLSAFAGQEIALRFRLASDVLTGQEGWYVDNVEIVDDPIILTNTATYSMAFGNITGDASSETLVLGSQVSPIVIPPSGDIAQTQHFGINLHPNPATDQVTLNMDGAFMEMVRVSVFNAQGQSVARWNLQAENATLPLQIKTATWPAGLYFVRVSHGPQMETVRLTLQ